jgi:hypothetical protein
MGSFPPDYGEVRRGSLKFKYYFRAKRQVRNGPVDP